MSTIKDWLSDKLFWLKTGTVIEVANEDKPIDQLVIRHQDFFFMIDMDVESGEPTGDFGWSRGQAMTPTPIRQFYVASKEYGETK